MDVTRIHLAEKPPAFCAACYSAKPQTRHIDFGAAYEGPTFAASDPEAPVAGGMTVTVDDLIICEDCLRQAAFLVGLTSAEALSEENDALTETVDRLSDKLAETRAYTDRLEAALSQRRELDARGPAAVSGSERPAGPPPSNRKRRPPSRAKG